MQRKRQRRIVNLGQRAMRDLRLRGSVIARALGVSEMTVSRWLSGDARPELDLRLKIAKRYAIDVELWNRGPAGQDLVKPTEPSPMVVDLAARHAVGETPVTVDERAAQIIDDAGAAPVERLAAITVRLRALKEAADEALDGLTDRDRITGRDDCARATAPLLDVVASWPAVRTAVALELAPPDASGAFGRLLDARAKLAELATTLKDQAQGALIAGIGKASQFDAKRSQCLGLLAKARLEGDAADLLKSQAWRDIVGKIGNILRPVPGALEAVQLGYEAQGAFAVDLLSKVATVRYITFPCLQYQADPVGFVETVLGCKVEPAQKLILESVRDHVRTSCASGRRIGKTDADAMVALWYYACFAKARVFITAPTERQVERVVWIAIRRLHAGSGVCLACRDRERLAQKSDPYYRVAAPCAHSAKLDGKPAEKAKTGMRSDDLREVSGFTAKQAVDVQGLAGANVFFIADEASGIDDQIFEAIEGNLSGGGRLLLTGNPTKNEGEHYESFFKKKKFYNSFRVSSETTSNFLAGRSVVPGLATREWVEEMAEMHGRDSAYFKIHVLGEHAIGEDGRLISVHTIAEAEERWFTAPDEGALVIGLDPAGAGGEGDESTFAVRRGDKIIEILNRRGLDDDGHLSAVLEIIKRHRIDRERTDCIVDTEGLGTGTYARLRQYAATQPLVLAVHGVRSSGTAVREPMIYEKVRDEMGAAFARWLKCGGAIPTDIKLAAELHALELKTKITSKGERVKLIPKVELRKILRRSPDRYDACALSVWEPSTMHEVDPTTATPAAGRVPAIDPYGVVAGSNSAGDIDPY